MKLNSVQRDGLEISVQILFKWEK